MKKFVRILCLALVAVMLCATLASCGGPAKNPDDAVAALKAEVDALKTKIAVGEATQPWKEKSLYDAIAIEAERRECADNKIVNYANSTFVPKYIAEMTVGTGTTQSTVFNPLCGC